MAEASRNAKPADATGSGNERRRYSFGSFAMSLKSATNILGSATSRLGTNMGVSDLNMETLRSVTTNVASGVASNISSIGNMSNIQDGFQASIAGIQSVSAASLGGIQASVAGLEGLSKTIMNNIAEKKNAITNEEALKAKGNYQLLDTIKSIEYQLLLILLYFVMALCINWYLIHGVAQTVKMVQKAKEFVDDPDLERKIREMGDSLQNDLRKYSDLNQLKEGMDGLRNGIAARLKDGANVIRDNIALDLKFNILGDQALADDPTAAPSVVEDSSQQNSQELWQNTALEEDFDERDEL